MIHRYSSRRSPLKDFLATRLQGARRYDRIAGFFSSSLLEVAGEALDRMTPEGGKTCVRVVCNSCLQPLDVQTARAAKGGMHREWCASLFAEIGAPMKVRLQRLYDFISSGLFKVKVLPDESLGLIRGMLHHFGPQARTQFGLLENEDWEACSQVFDSASQLEALRRGWKYATFSFGQSWQRKRYQIACLPF
jgi:hypothetical protein